MHTIITPSDLQSPDAPGDGWYIIEAAGEHPAEHTIAGTTYSYTQQLTPDALAAIAGAGVPAEGLLIDRDHFSRDPDKPSEAAGWVRELALCGDNLAARIEWTPLGLPLVQGKVYRHFSTVYPACNEDIMRGSTTPTRLIGLALTNAPNNAAGQPAITNRLSAPTPLPPAPGSDNPNPNTTPENTMVYPPELLAALGLANGATTEEVTAAAVDLKTRLDQAETAAATAAEAEVDAVIAAEEKTTGTTLTDEEKQDVNDIIVTNRARGLRMLTAICNSKRPARRYGDQSRQPDSVIANRRMAEQDRDGAIHNRALGLCRESAAAARPLDYVTARERARREYQG